MRSMAPKTSFNAVAFCRLSNVTKKPSLKLCSVRFWRHFFGVQFVNRMLMRKKRIGFIGQSIFYRMNRWSALIMYITAIYLTQCSTFFTFFLFSLSLFSTLSEALDKAKRKYQSKIKRLQEQQLNQHEKA